MAVEEIAGNAMDWKGFEAFGLVSSDPVTSGAFTSKVTTGGTPILQSGAADTTGDPYGIGFGFRTAYSGTGALNVTKSGIYLPSNWQKLFLHCRIRVVTSAIIANKKHELMAVRNAAGGTLFGLQWERGTTASELWLRHFIGHPASSGHPAGATEYLADTNTSNRSTNQYFDVLLVAEAAAAQLNLTMHIAGVAGNTIDDSAFTGGPFDPHVVIPGGSYQVILGSYGMDNAVSSQNVNYDVLRLGYTPPLAAAGAGAGGDGAFGFDPGFLVGSF